MSAKSISKKSWAQAGWAHAVVLAAAVSLGGIARGFDTAGSQVHLDAASFRHAGLTSVAWTSVIERHDVPTNFAVQGYGLRFEYNMVGFRGNAGVMYVTAAIQNLVHGFIADSAASRFAGTSRITESSGLGL